MSSFFNNSSILFSFSFKLACTSSKDLLCSFIVFTSKSVNGFNSNSFWILLNEIDFIFVYGNFSSFVIKSYKLLLRLISLLYMK
ncbi:hypothetical protein NWQ34_04860 [Mycoplasmopsis felis]|uniref:hypothetical protein n=1 Tax=Mycoplasmopsis felis TaxID=33923 RepID=UPI0021E02346|nr:hypothetical protein [Mycoplasmopsis felis]MCU9938908.1 hypothetical protein [Mycoplasmopsis felis]